MLEVNQWEQYAGRYCFKNREEKMHFSWLEGSQFLGKRNLYERIFELLKMLYITTDWKHKKWQHHHAVRRCFSAGGSGALYKINCIVEKASNVDILKQDLKTLKAWSQMDVPCAAP